MFHGEEHFVIAAHLVEAEVYEHANGRGRQQGLRHDAWDVQLLPRFPRVIHRALSVGILIFGS